MDAGPAVFKTAGGSSTEIRPRSSLSVIVHRIDRMTANDSQNCKGRSITPNG